MRAMTSATTRHRTWCANLEETTVDETGHNTGRRQLLATMALGGAATLAGAPAAAAAPEPVAAHEYWADKNGVKLWIYRKHTGAASAKKPLLFLVHGSSYSGKTMFDLHVPGRDNYSMMDHFARLGYDVWTMDH